MKRKYQYRAGGKTIEREYNYIPVRYIIAVLISLIEVVLVIGCVVALCYYVPYFYIAAYLTEIFCVIRIIASDDNPDYKVPWLLAVLVLPVVGFMLYFLFYSRKLQRKVVRRLEDLKKYDYERGDELTRVALSEYDPVSATQVRMLSEISGAKLFTNTLQTYFALGEDMHKKLLDDLRNAERFIYMEYFIIEEGKFWNSILGILREKAASGVEVRVIYDDVGCMMTLPGDYHKILASYGIGATPFSRLRGNADSEFNNRSHRKITVIDGRIGYTGGINLADEYINEVKKFGHWKDTGLRLEGEAVWELTRLFLHDWGINATELPEPSEYHYPSCEDIREDGYVMPFGDGPKPLYERRVAKSIIQNMLNSAVGYVYMTTPYLIIDNDTCQSIENAALRGVDVRIIVPHIPDKKLVFQMTKSYYYRLIRAGVRIFEYEPGFIHAKSYIADGECAMIGTVNLDYRSLVHHFENGVVLYHCAAIEHIKTDIDRTLDKCIEITEDMLSTNLPTRFVRAVVRIFAPLL